MKNLLTAFSIIAFLFIINPQSVFAQRGGGHTTPPPDPNNVHLFDRTLVTSGYGGSVIVGEMLLFDNEGPSMGSSFFKVGISPNEVASIDLFGFESHFPGFGGPYNDRMASVAFTGDCVGTYTFYDSPDGYASDDYCVVHVLVPLPTGKSYYVWNLNDSYTDDYVQVERHPVNGTLSGTVSNISVRKIQTI